MTEHKAYASKRTASQRIGRLLGDRFSFCRVLPPDAGVEVFEARDVATGDVVVAKISPLMPTPSEANPLGDEFRTLARLAHESIPEPRDFIIDRDANVCCLVLNWGDAWIPLSDWMSAADPLLWCVEWLDQMFDVLEYLHGVGVVHGRLAPHLVYVAGDPAKGVLEHVLVTGLRSSAWARGLKAATAGSAASPRASPEYVAPSVDIAALARLSVHVLSGDSWRSSPQLTVAASPPRQPAAQEREGLSKLYIPYSHRACIPTIRVGQDSYVKSCLDHAPLNLAERSLHVTCPDSSYASLSDRISRIKCYEVTLPDYANYTSCIV